MKLTSEQEMLDFGKDFATSLKNRTNTPVVIELIGDIGAGKTTFTRGLAKGLNISSPVTSPSFTISKSYALPTGGRLIHYDFYRIPDPGLMREDLNENLISPNNIIIVEWGNSIANTLPDNRIKISIHRLDDNSREIIFEDNSNCTTTSDSEPIPSKSPSTKNIASPASNRPSQLSLYLDTSTPTTVLKINDTEYSYTFANALAEQLLGFMRDHLAKHDKTFGDITDITFMSGPGSFTGLRIGAAIVNTLASELHIPLYDHRGHQHQIIIPDYGRPANISQPRK